MKKNSIVYQDWEGKEITPQEIVNCYHNNDLYIVFNNNIIIEEMVDIGIHLKNYPGEVDKKLRNIILCKNLKLAFKISRRKE